MTAPLSDKLESVKWGEFKMDDLFIKIETVKLPYKAKELPTAPEGEYTLPCLTSSFYNQGLNYYAPRRGATILKHVITIPSNSDVYRAYYQSVEFTVLSDAYAIRWKDRNCELTANAYRFLVACINKVTDLKIYSYKKKLGGWNVVRNKTIHVPIASDGTIDFAFMNSFIAELEAERVAELEAYLKVTGLNDCELTPDEKRTLEDFDTADWDDFNLEDLFGESTRGRRLKSEDRIPGSLPFVTAGEAETGVSAFIGNAVEEFAANTVTIDMFGSGKYRNYTYGADDHVTVVHTEKLPKGASIFVAAACHKAAYTGEFNYGHNFYPKDADRLIIKLPSKQGAPDYPFMARLISAIQKLVIKDVVLYANRKIEATKKVIESHRQTVEKGVS